MNTDTGHFVKEEGATPDMVRVEVGEVVKVKGERFRVMEIGDRNLTLELMSYEDRQKDIDRKRRAGLLSDSPRNRAERRREAALNRRVKA